MVRNPWLNWVFCTGTIKVVGRAEFSSEVQLRTCLLLYSHNCWQKSVPRGLSDEGSCFSLAFGQCLSSIPCDMAFSPTTTYLIKPARKRVNGETLMTSWKLPSNVLHWYKNNCGFCNCFSPFKLTLLLHQPNNIIT